MALENHACFIPGAYLGNFESSPEFFYASVLSPHCTRDIDERSLPCGNGHGPPGGPGKKDGRHDARLEGCCPDGCHTTPTLLPNTNTAFDADVVDPVAPADTLLCPKSIGTPPPAAEEPVKGCFEGFRGGGRFDIRMR